jgi:hypothetical protein
MRSTAGRVQVPGATVAAQEALLAYQRAREHWDDCDRCRAAATSTAPRWCDLGLRLMREGVAADAHWESCPRCQEAQGLVRSRQCAEGRSLDDAYRAACQRLAAVTQANPRAARS